MSGKEGFIGRWSRLKQDGPPEAVVEEPPAVIVEPEIVDERSDEEILEELGLPHPDDLKPGDDVKGFMKAAVPDRLRRVALRQLWRSNPVLANVDGLIDYGEDFTDSATVIENMQTLYQVGKGMWTSIVEGDDNEDEVAEATNPEGEEDNPQDAEPLQVDNQSETVVCAENAQDTVEPVFGDENQADFAPTKRRMSFT